MRTIIKTDGSARNGHIGIGVHVIYLRDNKVIQRNSYHHTLPSEKANGNRAELEAIIHALKHVARRGETEVHSDSSYAVNVTNDGKKIKKNLDLINQIRDLLQITGATLKWIPRRRNKVADKLSKKASQG